MPLGLRGPPGDRRGLFRAHPPDPVPLCLSPQAAAGRTSPDLSGSRGKTPSASIGGFQALPAGTCPPGLTNGLSCPSQAGPEGHPQCRAAGGPRLGHPGGLCCVPWPLWAPHTGRPAEPALPGAGELWRAECSPVGGRGLLELGSRQLRITYLFVYFFNKRGVFFVRVNRCSL